MSWIEDKLLFFLLLLVKLGALIWLGSLAIKGISSQPVLYRYYPDFSGETAGVMLMVLALLLGTAYGIVARWWTRSAAQSAAIHLTAPWVFFASGTVLVLWVYSGPVADASYVPLIATVLVSGWTTYITRWGLLSIRALERQARAGPDAQQVQPVGRSRTPAITFEDIYGNVAIKARLLDAARAITAPRKADARPRNGILLHGAPGNGKTVFAEALAGELKFPFITLSYADVASQWVGEKSVRVRQAFESAKQQQPCILFIDEVDSFLEARDGRADGVKEDRDLVNAMLTLLVDIRQCRVVLMAATNHIDRLDAAGVREGRFDFKVEITPPDRAARIGLLRKGLRDNVPDIQVDDTVIEAVAQRWNGFSAKRILAVTEELPSYVRTQGLTKLGFEDLLAALRQLQGQRGHVPENVLRLDELVLTETTRDMLEQIVARMADPEHTERHGGTLPSGVLFSGPPGTGKTAACKALAKEVGWAFLPATGAELARDPSKLDALHVKAQDLRPTIIFIDEADELVRNREFSPSTAATNKLLTLMDGAADRVRDLVWIAATNHPQQIDPALLRGGRFTEKVQFEPPDAKALGRWIAGWLSERKVKLAHELSAEQIAQLLAGQTVANAEAVLQSALNRAIARRELPVMVHLTDLQQSARSVLPAA